MRITYDSEVDALSVRFRETTVTTTEIAPGIVAEYDADGRLAGLEILDAGSLVGDRATFREVILQDITGTGTTAPAHVRLDRASDPRAAD